MIKPDQYPKIAKLVVIIAVLISIFCGFLIPKLRFDYNFESFFPDDADNLGFYDAHRQRFGSDNDFILIGISDKGGIFNPTFLGKIAALTDSLQSMSLVREVLSPTNVSSYVLSPLGFPVSIPYLHPDSVALLAQDSAKVMTTETLRGNIFSATHPSVSIVVRTIGEPNKAQSDSIVSQINRIFTHFSFSETHISGKAQGQDYYIKKMTTEMITFTVISALLAILFLYISFRSFWGVWVPISIVVLTAVWLMGLLILWGKLLNILTIILPAILFIVGMSDVVHITEKYLHELRKGLPKMAAIKITLKEVGWATFLTLITTAAGFLTLNTASIEPIRAFGLYTGLGVLIAYILSFTFLPAILVLSPAPSIAEKGKGNAVFWDNSLRNLFAWVLRYKTPIFWVSMLLIPCSLIGVFNIKINNYLLEDLAQNDPTKQNVLFFEEHFAGVRPFELSVHFSDTTQDCWQLQNLQKLEKIENFCKQTYQVGSLLSPVTVAKSAFQSANSGSIENYRLPKNEDEYQTIAPLIKQIRKQKALKGVATKDGAWARIAGRLTDHGGYKMRQYNSKLDSFMVRSFSKQPISHKLTGAAHLIDVNNSYLAIDMVESLAISVLIIALIMGLLYRSFSMILIALIPNLLPSLVVAGIMGYAGIDLKVSTSIIFNIALGIAVDDTIHFLSMLKLELNKNKSLLYALKTTYIAEGKAVIVLSFILCSGFLALIFSDFNSIYYMGLLVSITLAVGLIGDLLLLPVLIVFFYKGKPTNKTIGEIVEV